MNPDPNDVLTRLKGLKFLPSLDGWRALSIGMVLLGHSQLTYGFPHQFDDIVLWIPGGDFGVRFFFVISGFLITWLLLKEHLKTGTISLKGFYWRRSLRILPAYIVFLSTLAALSLVSQFSLTFESWIALFTYTVNYLDVSWTGAHVWSLSIEEQFYFIWPLSFFLFLRNDYTSKTIILALSIPIFTFPVFRIIGYLNHYSFPLNHHSFLLHGDALAIGCVGAVVMWSSPWAVQCLTTKKSFILAVGVLLVIMPHVLSKLLLLGIVTVPLGLTMSSSGVCILVLLSILHPESVAFRWLQCHWFASLGTLSYSIYLWQQLFCTDPRVFGLARSSLLFSFPLWLGSTFFVALISYFYIERPFLKLKNRVGD